jgi:hypothetical protein
LIELATSITFFGAFLQSTLFNKNAPITYGYFSLSYTTKNKHVIA